MIDLRTPNRNYAVQVSDTTMLIKVSNAGYKKITEVSKLSRNMIASETKHSIDTQRSASVNSY